MTYRQKQHSVIPQWLSLSLVAGGLYLALGQVAQAAPSNGTGPVHGQGAPSVPTLTVPTSIKLNEPAVAVVTGSTDPDGDPIEYEVRWCSEAAGAGSCVLGETQIFTKPGSRYVMARAVTPRGFPQDLQGASPWSEENLIRVSSFGGGCTSGATVSVGTLTFSCPVTTSEAKAIPFAYGSSFTLNSVEYATFTWDQAFNYCKQLGEGYRIPTMSELRTLYSAYPNGGMRDTLGWPVDVVGSSKHYYWSSTSGGIRFYQSKKMLNDDEGSADVSYTGNIVSCVR
ncbi:adhesion domain-containing protein [Aeromonas veronii]